MGNYCLQLVQVHFNKIQPSHCLCQSGPNHEIGPQVKKKSETSCLIKWGACGPSQNSLWTLLLLYGLYTKFHKSNSNSQLCSTIVDKWGNSSAHFISSAFGWCLIPTHLPLLELICQYSACYPIYMGRLSIPFHEHRPPNFKVLKSSLILSTDWLCLPPQVCVYDGH